MKKDILISLKHNSLFRVF